MKNFKNFTFVLLFLTSLSLPVHPALTPAEHATHSPAAGAPAPVPAKTRKHSRDPVSKDKAEEKKEEVKDADRHKKARDGVVVTVAEREIPAATPSPAAAAAAAGHGASATASTGPDIAALQAEFIDLKKEFLAYVTNSSSASAAATEFKEEDLVKSMSWAEWLKDQMSQEWNKQYKKIFEELGVKEIPVDELIRLYATDAKTMIDDVLSSHTSIYIHDSEKKGLDLYIVFKIIKTKLATHNISDDLHLRMFIKPCPSPIAAAYNSIILNIQYLHCVIERSDDFIKSITSMLSHEMRHIAHRHSFIAASLLILNNSKIDPSSLLKNLNRIQEIQADSEGILYSLDTADAFKKFLSVISSASDAYALTLSPDEKQICEEVPISEGHPGCEQRIRSIEIVERGLVLDKLLNPQFYDSRERTAALRPSAAAAAAAASLPLTVGSANLGATTSPSVAIPHGTS